MFRDREKALQALQKQLLEEDEEEESKEEFDEDDDLPSEVYDDYTADLRAYNSDKSDTELDEYSDTVYDQPQRKTGCLLWLSLLITATLLAISWYLAKQGGLL